TRRADSPAVGWRRTRGRTADRRKSKPTPDPSPDGDPPRLGGTRSLAGRGWVVRQRASDFHALPVPRAWTGFRQRFRSRRAGRPPAARRATAVPLGPWLDT